MSYHEAILRIDNECGKTNLGNLNGYADSCQFLPAYAPELNVVDHCRGHTTYGEMANFIPYDVEDPAQEVAHSLIAKHDRRDQLNAFFRHARLKL
jgi:hypothetical protein